MNDKWTVGAAECYERGCVCSGCLYSEMETKCKMKDAVIDLVRKFGKPPQKLIGRIKCNNNLT